MHAARVVLVSGFSDKRVRKLYESRPDIVFRVNFPIEYVMSILNANNLHMYDVDNMYSTAVK